LSPSGNAGRRAAGALMARLARLVRIAPEGAAISFAIAAAGILCLLLGLRPLGGAILIAALAITAFFRDPDRFPERSDGVVLSGADGKVSDIADAALPGAPGVKYQRVSVFMSPLNVHVNRAPVGGAVESIEYTPGKFRAAFRDQASEHNERTLIVFTGADGRRYGMAQVAGYIARRIVCRVRANDRIQPAQRIGLIMFGSRVDHFIPPDYRVTVSIGSRVRGGLSIIGERIE